MRYPVADLRRREGRAPPGSNFFQFHAVFGKIWQIRMLAPPLGSWRRLLGEILDPPLVSGTRDTHPLIITYNFCFRLIKRRAAISERSSFRATVLWRHLPSTSTRGKTADVTNSHPEITSSCPRPLNPTRRRISCCGFTRRRRVA